jgi:hypothetical protein
LDQQAGGEQLTAQLDVIGVRPELRERTTGRLAGDPGPLVRGHGRIGQPDHQQPEHIVLSGQQSLTVKLRRLALGHSGITETRAPRLLVPRVTLLPGPLAPVGPGDGAEAEPQVLQVGRECRSSGLRDLTGHPLSCQVSAKSLDPSQRMS